MGETGDGRCKAAERKFFPGAAIQKGICFRQSIEPEREREIAMSATEIIGIVTITLSMLTGFIYFLKLIQAWMLHRTLRDAIKRDSAIAGDLVERIDRSDWPDGGRQRLGSDDRNGLVLIAIGFAIL